MRLYFATGTRTYLWMLFVCNVKKILISYAYPEPWKGSKLIKQNDCKLLCDSGAFTAWSKGKQVDIDSYIAFIKKHQDIIDRPVNLDVIPGNQGTIPTPEEKELAAQKGWDNLEYMKSHGIDPIHVFHYGEDFKWLKKMIDSGLDYIGVSPSNDLHDQAKIQWLDHAFRYIAKSSNPNIKTHAFGVTSIEILKRYPWYSADSATYSLTAAFGNIITPFGRFCISAQNADDPDHILNKPKEFQDQLSQYLDPMGITIKALMEEEGNAEKNKENLAKAYQLRNIVNIMTLLDMEKEINEKGPTLDYLKQDTLFDVYN